MDICSKYILTPLDYFEWKPKSRGSLIYEGGLLDHNENQAGTKFNSWKVQIIEQDGWSIQVIFLFSFSIPTLTHWIQEDPKWILDHDVHTFET